MEIYKDLPKELKEKILCETLTEKNVLNLYKVLGHGLKFCEKIKDLDWKKVFRNLNSDHTTYRDKYHIFLQTKDYSVLDLDFYWEFKDFFDWKNLREDSDIFIAIILIHKEKLYDYILQKVSLQSRKNIIDISTEMLDMIEDEDLKMYIKNVNEKCKKWNP